MALSEDHGKISHLKFKIAHNEKTANVYVSWKDESRDDKIEDLDQFIDSLAVMFPLTPTANSMTMGDANNPVNAWFWRADKAEPYDVIAHGFGTSKRRGGSTLGLSAASRYHNGRWHVVFQRSLRVNMISHDQVGFKPGAISGIAFAVWDGSNKERSAQKSFSGNWLPFEIDA
jgi:DMSO reductase family type II enzyme heme b subunit